MLVPHAVTSLIMDNLILYKTAEYHNKVKVSNEFSPVILNMTTTLYAKQDLPLHGMKYNCVNSEEKKKNSTGLRETC